MVSASVPGGPALMFCPAHRPALFAKAAARADAVVLDLEDAVPPAERSRARAALVEHPLDPRRTIVRVNATDSPDHARDLAALRSTGYLTVMLAKTETADQLAALSGWDVVALCETPLGVANAAGIAASANVVALMWGSEDLAAALGAASSRTDDGRLRDVMSHARWQVLGAAKAHGRKAIDTVFPDFGDDDGLARESADAAAAGFDLKACIHPGQAEVVRAGFRPTYAQVAWALRIAGAADADGATSVDGQMVDAPVLRQARSILERRVPGSDR